MRAQESTILDFIGGLKKVFIIPPFQRNYEWTSEQCTELFSDILKACKNNTTHYLGNIVYYLGKIMVPHTVKIFLLMDNKESQRF